MIRLQSHYPKHGIVKFKDVRKIIDKLDPYHNDMYSNRDDLNLARLFADVFTDLLRYNSTANSWMFYDGRVWKRDEGSMITEACMKMFIEAMQLYYYQINDPDWIKFILKYGSRGSRKRLIEDSRDYNFIKSTSFDQDPYLFNCQDCVIDLRTRKAIEHDPSLLLSKISNVYFNPEVISEDFDRFIHEVMQDDEEKIRYIQTVFGYALIGENTQEQCFIFYGPKTRNGKSTLLDTMSHLFGDYALNIQPESLANKKKDSRSASGDIARLDGCRYLHMNEPPKKMTFDVALLKALTGRDPITARHMYEREYEFTPIFTLVINTNYLPIVADNSFFTSGRVKVVTFDRHFTPEEQDRRLKSRLKKRDNITGIFNWCLEGLRIFEENEGMLREPKAVIQATEDYQNKSDKIQNFIDDCLSDTPGIHVSVGSAYSKYSEWCRDNGFGTENKSNFVEEIKTKGLYSKTGTINGKTVRNVIKDHSIDWKNVYDDEIPFD